jgi:hypothetical protein
VTSTHVPEGAKLPDSENNYVKRDDQAMRTSHAILLRLRHDPQFDFGKVEVEFVDRGARGDRSVVRGDKIIRLEQGWMEIEWENRPKFIPFHRIRSITYEGTIMWEKDDEFKPEA